MKKKPETESVRTSAPLRERLEGRTPIVVDQEPAEEGLAFGLVSLRTEERPNE